VQGLEDLHEDVLCDILSLTPIVQDTRGKGQHPALVFLHQFGKCFPIAVAALRNDLLIGVGLDSRGLLRRCRGAHRTPFDHYLAPSSTLAHDVVEIPSSAACGESTRRHNTSDIIPDVVIRMCHATDVQSR
jgi:hypothetical protein